jgi:hypothetical protein
MAETPERQRTVVRIPRVEFDLSALAAGAIGWLAYQGSWSLLASMLGAGGGGELRGRFAARLVEWMGLPFLAAALDAPRMAASPFGGGGLPAWKFAVVAGWMLVLWSVVAGAIARIYAMRIARDESIGLTDAFGFAFSNLKQFVLAPVFVAAAGVFFLGLAALAGALSAIPGVGPFVQVAAHPLALLAGLVVIVIAAGGVFGLPLMQSALAAERNGTLDAISRTFSYVFTRPVAYIVSCGLVALVCRVIDAFGGAFLDITTRAMRFGAGWNTHPADSIDADRAIGWGALAGRDDSALFAWPDPQRAEGLPVVGFYVAWFMTALAAIAVHGYVLAYFVGGLTDVYFMLRRDVDGIDEGEVYAEGAEPSLGAPVAGEPSGGTRP